MKTIVANSTTRSPDDDDDDDDDANQHGNTPMSGIYVSIG